jgi:hypothetical protein
MLRLRAFFWLCLLLTSSATAEIGVVTQIDGGVRLLRGSTWFKLVAGARIDEADIVDVALRAQVQIELAGGAILNHVGPGALLLATSPAKNAPSFATLTGGWLKLTTGAPGMRLRMVPFDLLIPDGIVVVHVEGTGAELFVEAGSAKMLERDRGGADGVARDARRGEYWAKTSDKALVTQASAPKAFVSAMPPHFVDPLPTLAGKIKSKPVLVAEGEITYAEAAPWLDGPDRNAFEKRFAGRLRDPVFRRAAEPYLGRHPAWDRIVHPEKYLPANKAKT